MKNVIIKQFILIIILSAINAWAATPVNESFLKNINTDADETSCAVTSDGELFVFARKPKGSSNSDLYYTEFKSGKWSEPKVAADLNSDSDEISPFLPSDGKFILFSSNRQGSLKNSSAEKPSYDIYYSERKGEGWEKPVLLFGAVNTTDDEINPFITKDGKLIYFTRVRFNDNTKSKIIKVYNKNDFWEDVQTAEISNNPVVEIYMFKKSFYKPGAYITGFKKGDLSRRDVFYSDDSGKDIHSIDSAASTGDNYSVCELDQKSLIVSSNSNGIDSSYDFFIKKISSDLKRETPVTLYLKVENNNYSNPDGIKIKVLLFSSLKKNSWPEKSEIKSPDSSGIISVIADPEIKRVLILPGNPGMKPFNVEFLTDNESLTTATIKVEPSGEEEFIIKPVYFNFNSSEIQIIDVPYIHELIDYLRNNEAVRISLEGYSDGIGSYRSNLNISLRRAERVKEYLVKEGIKKNRIKTRGHGYIKDKLPDTSQYNRRVEFNVISQ